MCMYILLTKREVKMAGYWPTSSRSIKTQKENEANTHAAILTELTWSIKDLLYGIKNKLNRLRISSGKRQTSWQLRS